MAICRMKTFFISIVSQEHLVGSVKLSNEEQPAHRRNVIHICCINEYVHILYGISPYQAWQSENHYALFPVQLSLAFPPVFPIQGDSILNSAPEARNLVTPTQV